MYIQYTFVTIIYVCQTFARCYIYIQIHVHEQHTHIYERQGRCFSRENTACLIESILSMHLLVWQNATNTRMHSINKRMHSLQWKYGFPNQACLIGFRTLSCPLPEVRSIQECILSIKQWIPKQDLFDRMQDCFFFLFVFAIRSRRVHTRDICSSHVEHVACVYVVIICVTFLSCTLRSFVWHF